MTSFKILICCFSLALPFSSFASNLETPTTEVSTNIVFGSTEPAPEPAPLNELSKSNNPAIVGTWVGVAQGNPEAENCMPYKWQVERSANGEWHMVSADDHTTLLDAKGHWWTTAGTYHEQTDGAEVYSYRYLVLQDGSEVELTLPDDSSELLCNRGRKTITEKKVATPVPQLLD